MLFEANTSLTQDHDSSQTPGGAEGRGCWLFPLRSPSDKIQAGSGGTAIAVNRALPGQEARRCPQLRPGAIPPADS